MEKTSLESSIREESQQAIQAIREKEASEIKRLDEVCDEEIEEYRKKIEAEIDAGIEQELSKLENRSLLDRKKLKLRTIDNFINSVVDETVKGMRDDPRYRLFLLDTVSEAAEQIHARVEVHLKGQDQTLGDEIMKELRAYSSNHDLVIQEDNTIKWGGCLINDEAGGRIFNGTIERIYFRKYQVIRQEIVKIMREMGLID
jgi:vacuolar-type H+-ATPase subunit E/Vma4